MPGPPGQAAHVVRIARPVQDARVVGHEHATREGGVAGIARRRVGEAGEPGGRGKGVRVQERDQVAVAARRERGVASGLGDLCRNVAIGVNRALCNQR